MPGPVTRWLERRTLWQFALILWSGALLCELLVFGLLHWLGRQKRRRKNDRPPDSYSS
jgi:hypothetical protein